MLQCLGLGLGLGSRSGSLVFYITPILQESLQNLFIPCKLRQSVPCTRITNYRVNALYRVFRFLQKIFERIQPCAGGVMYFAQLSLFL